MLEPNSHLSICDQVLNDRQWISLAEATVLFIPSIIISRQNAKSKGLNLDELFVEISLIICIEHLLE